MVERLKGVDREIYNYACNATSFLLLAGAGSGKTRTLVNVLQAIKETKRQEFTHKGQKVAVITYTNAACEEIKRRLGYDSAFAVSTIHSFAWALIQPFTDDIREWKVTTLSESIKELCEKEQRARTDSSRNNHKSKRLKKEAELKKLPDVVKFIYSPTELLSGLGTLTHSDVIKLCAYFLNQHELMRKILVNQFPILFIDECQDTQKDLLQAIIATQKQESNQLSVGLFGDLMQRIYSDGYVGLRDNLPSDWEMPQKEENWRSPERVVTLINKIRENEDTFQQTPKKKEKGTIRLFIAQNDEKKEEVEHFVKSQMAEICDDPIWGNDDTKVETLALEHKMIAHRVGFANFYNPISHNQILKDGLLNKTGRNVLFLTDVFIPFIESVRDGDNFRILRILEKHNHQIMGAEGKELVNVMKETKEAVSNFSSQCSDDAPVKILLTSLYENAILAMPDELVSAIKLTADNEADTEEPIKLWAQALEVKFNELIHYFRYVDGELGYSTHQGVKGLEYPRVMAILDDEDAGGFLFSYEKLLGAKELSSTDTKNEDEGKDSAISRTRRLFYVICSRAEESLAIVAYSKNPDAVKNYALENGWFENKEVIIYDSVREGL